MNERQASIASYLLSQAEQGRYPTLRAVSEALGNLPLPAIQRVRTKLVSQGKLPAPPRSWRHPKGAPKAKASAETKSGVEAGAEGGVLPTPSPSEIDLTQIQSAQALTTEEQRARLSWLADNAQREEVKLAAISALAKIDSMTGTAQTKGFVLLTKEDQVFHLSLLMKAVGPLGTDEARSLAFGS